ncbi:MAG TPA: phospholipase D-like domain-containing protein, partial [Cyclobacteriaceae bacterium]|nr:phospholipase D-like domain-containing protein [Cyclobacteriaceae bacterium]
MSSIAKAIGPISYSQTSHNNVKLLRAGNEFFGKLLDLIEQAKHIIYFQIYIFEDDETGKQVADALMKAARRGVKIYMLVDGYASQSLPAEFIKNLQRSGIKFRKFEPIFRSKSYYFGRRLHHKVMVFDSCSALVGGINISNNYSDEFDKPAWLDWAVSVKGEAAAQLEEVCRIKAEKAGYR